MQQPKAVRVERLEGVARVGLAVPTLVAALLVSGCRAESALAQGSPWAWLALPVLGLVLVEGLVLLLGPRRGEGTVQVGGSSLPPRRDRRQTALLWALLAAIVVALAFAGVNWAAEIEPADKLRNVALWFLGTVLGSASALVLAWRLHRRTIHRPTSPSGGGSDEATRLEIRDA